MSELTITISEEERQLIILALAQVASERPGWDEALNALALKMDNDRDGRAEMFERLRIFSFGGKPR